MRSKWMITALAGAGSVIVSVALLAARRSVEARPDARQADIAAGENGNAQGQHVAHLNRELQQLKLRVATQEAQRSEPATPSSAEAPEPAPEAPSLSPKERQALRVAHYSDALESEPRDARAATSFEQALTSAVGATGQGTVDRVECRTTLCVLEISKPGGRVDFTSLVVNGPVKNGAHYYRTDDDRTVAYIAMPGHKLQRPVLEPSLAE